MARHFVAFLTAGGVDVVAMGSHGIVTAAEVGTLDADRVVAMVTAADHPDAEAVLVPDTAMHTLAIVDKLEAAVGKPVLTANQVTVWKGLELLGQVPPLPGLGTSVRRTTRDRASSSRLTQESTPSIIADKLRQAIGHGELKPGAQLGEADLARKLGVSRGPLREGMQRLTQEGLLVSIRNRGLFVIDMTPERHPRHVPGPRGDRTRRRPQDPRRRPRRGRRSCWPSSTQMAVATDACRRRRARHRGSTSCWCSSPAARG